MQVHISCNVLNFDRAGFMAILSSVAAVPRGVSDVENCGCESAHFQIPVGLVRKRDYSIRNKDR